MILEDGAVYENVVEEHDNEAEEERPKELIHGCLESGRCVA